MLGHAAPAAPRRLHRRLVPGLVQRLQLPLKPVHVVIVFVIGLPIRAARLAPRTPADGAIQTRGGVGGPGGVAAAPVAG
jgi:hypothetical protein